MTYRIKPRLKQRINKRIKSRLRTRLRTRLRIPFFCGVSALSTLSPLPALADGDADYEDWNAKYQATYIWQRKDAFNAAYSGQNSLSPVREKSYSFTATAAFGYRPWTGGELYFNPEVAQGVPLSNLTGLGGFTNGEMARTSGPNPTFYRARLFLRQTWDMADQGGQAREAVASDANQLAGSIAPRRVVWTLGNLSVLDIFDDNAYSHDPRTQFMNWSLMTYGAYDYAADARGYSWGSAVEWYRDAWAIRFGRFMQPREPNQMQLDPSLFRHYGDQVEVEHAHQLAGRPGTLRVLAFRNHAKMSRYQDALNYAAAYGGVPDINNVRYGDQTKTGFGVSLEQQITDDVGLFARGSWADGKTETYAFTEIDNSVSGGVLINGNAWRRPLDQVGIGFARNGLSRQHRDYLAQGGMGFFIGDGTLNYRPETILETYYSASVAKGTQVSLDFQHIENPAYNADRGPVNTIAIRLHTEF